jgi:hypothetical protein
MTNKKLDTNHQKENKCSSEHTPKAASSKKKNDHHSERIISIQLLVSRIFRFVGGYFLEEKKSEIEKLFVAICSVDDQIIVMIVKIFMKQKKIINQHQYNIIGNCSCRTHL